MHLPTINFRTRLFLIRVCVLLVATLFSLPGWAQLQKFVYVYNSSGEILTPVNAASQCPDPEGGTHAANTCKGVPVENGEYNIRFSRNTLVDAENIVLLANEYEFVNANLSPDGQDIYVLVDSKRRADSIDTQQTNSGLNINRLSEAVVKAVEQVSDIAKGKKGSVRAELSQRIAQIAIKKLNAVMGNSQTDNNPTDTDKIYERDYIEVQQEKLDDNDQSVIDSLAVLAVENENNDAAQSVIRKNVLQAIVQPALLSEVSERVFSHVFDVKIDPASPTLLLEADKYLVYLNEQASLSTANSINPAQFFAYTWLGVESDKSTATFSRSDQGSYLVCATGEIDGANDSSTDCVRMTVKNEVDAVARSSARRIGTGNTLTLSGSLSIGAETYNWSGSGQFGNVSTEQTTWTAPNLPGTYEITLVVNNEDTDTVSVEVFDVLPVAIAEADEYISYLVNGSVTVSLASGSISTDGSAVDSLEWSIVEQPDSSLPVLSSTSNRISSFSTSTPGKYTIQLQATKRGISDIAELVLAVRLPGAPVADAGSDIVTYRNQETVLDGSNSYASDGKDLSYLWQSASGIINNSLAAIANFVSSELGEYNISLEVNDGQLSDTDTVSVAVVNRLPVASDDVYANLLNEILIGQLIGVDMDADSLSYTLVSQPSNGGVTIDEVSGEFTYLPGGVKGCKYQPYQQPTSNDAGGKDVPVIKLCADKYVAAPGEVINLTTSNSINASKFSGYRWEGGAVGDEYDIRLATFSSTEPGDYQICVIGEIGQSNNTSTACVDVIVGGSAGSIDSNVETGYTDSFTYIVNDGFGNSNSGVIYITIGWENAIPTVENASISTNEDTPISGQLLGSDLDGHSITFQLAANPTLGTVNIDAGTGGFTYTPNLNSHGQDSFGYIANDGLQNSAMGVISITINSTNDYPVAYFTGVLTTLEDNAVSGTLGAVDPDEDVLNFQLATIPDKGSVTIDNAQTGAFTYTPNPDQNGADSFFFVVHDSEYESNVARVDINITPVNDAPVSDDLGPLDVYINEPLKHKVSATDVDKDALVYKLQSTTQKGQIALDAVSGQFTYTPDGVSLGADSFTYTASDTTLSSQISTVSLNLLPFNNAPLAESFQITVMEGVTYGGILLASDIDNAQLNYSLVNDGRLGHVSITDSNSGSFTYTPNAFANGADFFTYTVSDGDKVSAIAVVNVNILSAHSLCQGPGNDARDQDIDGYADFVELAFGTSVSDASSTPFGLVAGDYGISFIDDDDSDNYADISEMWLNTDPNNNTSRPSESTLNGLPSCFSTLYDNVAPALFAFDILTPSVDVSGGNAVVRFALTAIDNAAGVTEASLVLRSPSGAEVNAQTDIVSGQVVFYTEFDSEIFSQYAEQGTWVVSQLLIKDAMDNALVLSTTELEAHNYPSTVNIINANSDIVAPVLDALSILTPTIDVSVADVPASFSYSISDNVSGIANVYLKLTSPSGAIFHWGENAHTDQPLNLSENINTNAFTGNSEPGLWQITELQIRDHAGNIAIYDTTQLAVFCGSSTITVINPTPDTQAPTLVDFDINSSIVDLDLVSPLAHYTVIAADDKSGVATIEILLESASGTQLISTYSSLNPTTSLTVNMQTGFTQYELECGLWTVASVSLTDAVGNNRIMNTQELSTQGLDVELYGISAHCVGGNNRAPQADAQSIETPEDQSYSGQLIARDADGDTLTYLIENNGTKGSATITNTQTGAFTYTPKKDAFGVDYFQFKADDGLSESNIATVTVVITPQPDDTIALDFGIDVVQNTTYYGTFQASDADGESLTYIIVGNGSLGTATVLSNGTFQYMPNSGVIGGDQFTYQVNDSNSVSTVATVSVTILPDLVLTGFDVLTPVVNGLSEYATISCNLSLSKDITQISEAYLTLEGPSGATVGFQAIVNGDSYPFLMTNNVFTTNQPLAQGTWKFKNLLIKRSGEIFSEFVVGDIEALGFDASVEVIHNNPPVAGTHLEYTVSLDSTLSGSLNATDLENDPLQYELVNASLLGTLTITDINSGAFSFVPHTVGTETVQFKVFDGVSYSNIGEISITVSPVNGAPIALAGEFSVTAGMAYLGKLSAIDPEHSPLTYSIVNEPDKGSLVITDLQQGNFEYRPNPGVTGNDSITFKANDGQLDSNVATVLIIINAENAPPIANAHQFTAFQNVSYSGQLSGFDPENNTVSYYISVTSNLGTLQVNSATGSFTYTPLPDVIGMDSFSFFVSDGVNNSLASKVTVNIINAAQACGTGGINTELDKDGDGYADAWETVFATDIIDALSTPMGLDAANYNSDFNSLDYDADSYIDIIELWLGSDFMANNSIPEFVLEDCFLLQSDGIKPRLAGFHLQTPTINIAQESAVKFTLSLLDNASGVKRARLGLISPSGAFLTSSVSFSETPRLVGSELIVDIFSDYAEEGVWQVSGLTIFDDAGNRLDLSTQDFEDAGLATDVTVVNSNSDSLPPAIDSLVIVTPYVYPGTADDSISVQIGMTDGASGVSSVRIDYISPSGTIVSASQTFAENPKQIVTQLDTPRLSQYLEQGLWTINNLLLVDAAGNSIQLAQSLETMGFTIDVQITNPLSDAQAPNLESFSLLTPEVYPAGGNSKISFGLTAYDDASGIELIEIEIIGPSGQILYAHGEFDQSYPLMATIQINTATLSNMLEIGIWEVSTVDIFDNAGNKLSLDQAQLNLLNLPTLIDVRY